MGNEEIPQIYTVCGRGSRSSLRVLRPGLAVTEMAVSPLPGNPTAVWTTKRTNTSEFDNYIIVSFTNATLVRTFEQVLKRSEIPPNPQKIPASVIHIREESEFWPYPGLSRVTVIRAYRPEKLDDMHGPSCQPQRADQSLLN